MKQLEPIGENVSKKISLFNFVLTFFIVFSHWTHYYSLTNPGSDSRFIAVFAELFSILGIISLATFFMLSGYLFWRGIHNFEDLKGKMLRRLVSLGIPFLFWNFVYLIYNIAYGLYKGNLDMSFTDVLLGFSFDPFNSPMWYILALIVLMCIAPLMMTLKNHARISALATVLLFLAAYMVSIFTEEGFWLWNWVRRLISYAPLYFVGAYLGMHRESVISKELFYNKFYSIAAAVLSLGIIVTLTALDVHVAFKWLFYQLLPILMWIAVPAKIFTRLRISFPLTVSFFVYAMHSVLIMILNSLWTQKLFGNVDFPIAVDVIFHVLLVGILYLICLCVAYLAKKLLPEKIYRIFAGGHAGRKMF